MIYAILGSGIFVTIVFFWQRYQIKSLKHDKEDLINSNIQLSINYSKIADRNDILLHQIKQVEAVHESNLKELEEYHKNRENLELALRSLSYADYNKIRRWI